MNNHHRELPDTYTVEVTGDALIVSADLGDYTVALALPLPKPLSPKRRYVHIGSCLIIRGAKAPHTIHYIHVRQTDAVRAYMRLKAELERSIGNEHR